MNKKEESEALNDDPEKKKIFSITSLWHPILNFYLPHDYGGMADYADFDAYGHLRTYGENVDLPVIKPKTTSNNKNDFHIVFEKENLQETIDSKTLNKPIIKEWETTVQI